MTRLVGAGLVVVALLAGCGRVGFPVPPDDYGLGIRIQAERKKEEQARKEQEARREPQASGPASHGALTPAPPRGEQAPEAAARNAEEGLPVPPEEPILPEMRPLTGR